MRMESEDFVKWTQPVEVLRGPQTAQTYSMPVFCHAGVYLGLPALLRGGGPGRVTTELTWSPDTKVWHFVPENRLAQLKVIRIPDQPWRRVDEGTQFIPLAEKEDSYEWGCIYAAATPVVLDDEIRILLLRTKGQALLAAGPTVPGNVAARRLDGIHAAGQGEAGRDRHEAGPLRRQDAAGNGRHT